MLLIKKVPKEKSTKGMPGSTFTKELRSIKWGDRANLSDVCAGCSIPPWPGAGRTENRMKNRPDQEEKFEKKTKKTSPLLKLLRVSFPQTCGPT